MKYVIRGKSGMKFEACEIGKEAKEATYPTLEKAEMALKQLQETLPFEEFEIISIEIEESKKP